MSSLLLDRHVLSVMESDDGELKDYSTINNALLNGNLPTIIPALRRKYACNDIGIPLRIDEALSLSEEKLHVPSIEDEISVMKLYKGLCSLMRFDREYHRRKSITREDSDRLYKEYMIKDDVIDIMTSTSLLIRKLISSKYDFMPKWIEECEFKDGYMVFDNGRVLTVTDITMALKNSKLKELPRKNIDADDFRRFIEYVIDSSYNSQALYFLVHCYNHDPDLESYLTTYVTKNRKKITQKRLACFVNDIRNGLYKKYMKLIKDQ
jgi:hypothetical protein